MWFNIVLHILGTAMLLGALGCSLAVLTDYNPNDPVWRPDPDDPSTAPRR